MQQTNFGNGPWEYRYVCVSCGHAVRAPKNKAPCSRCGGDFGPKVSMRKLYLEPEKPLETVEVEYVGEKTFWESIKEFFGITVEPRVEIRKEKRRAPRRWRWQSHAEVEEESGIIRHEEFLT
ncbi:MAG TPA: hypothetical protein DEB39_09800 [Planctomycetaceae bacterium]|nr:hypothetical protein [Planctomycetaceae bacterium]